MTNLEDNKHRLELIKMARELLNEEYINRRAQDHNRWLAESDLMWRTNRVKLPYPPFAAYPTDEEIVAKATVLYNFVSTKSENTVDTSVPETPPTPAEIAATSKILSKPEIPQPGESPWEKYLSPEVENELKLVDIPIDMPNSQTAVAENTDPVSGSSEQTQPAQPSLLVQNLLPGWIRRSQST